MRLSFYMYWRSQVLLNQLGGMHDRSKDDSGMPPIAEDARKAFMRLLQSAPMMTEVISDGKTREEDEANLNQWEFHDLLFHSRSRLGRLSNPYGETYRFLGKLQPAPAVPPKRSNEVIELYKPNIDQLKVTDKPFTWVLETRKSIGAMRIFSRSAPVFPLYGGQAGPRR